MSNRSVSLAVVATAALTILLAANRSADAKVAGPPEVAWKDMTYAQKKAYMKAAVLPKTKKIFQEFDPKTFKVFDCSTCHGKDGVDRKFKMPSNDIHPLPNTPEAFQAKMKEEPTWPKWTKFMAEKVEPAMGTLLDVPVFDPKNPVKGTFSCANCHKLEGPGAKP
jgi:mono/diheme cytochrome c family protein